MPRSAAASAPCGSGGPRVVDDDLNRRYNDAIDLLPPLSRAVFLLSRVDDLAYADIAWRCGIDAAEVQLRLADALFAIGRALDGHVTIAMHVRGELLIWRAAAARYRLRRRHWRLGRCYREQQARLNPRDTWHRRFANKIKGLIR